MNFYQAIHQKSLQMKKSFYYLLAKKELQLKTFCDVYINYVLLIGSSNQFWIYKCEHFSKWMGLSEQNL